MLNVRRVGMDLKRQMEAEIKAGQQAARATVQLVGEETLGTMRDQARAGFPMAAERMARTWRLQVFPRPGKPTLRPTALISSRAPTIADGFDRGATIRAKGGKFLAVPTQENRGGGLRNRRPRITPAQMVAAKKQTFVLPIKGSQNKLWCIRVTEANSRTKAGRIQRQAIAGNRVRVGARRTSIGGRSLSAGQYGARLLEQGFVPMFLLLRQVQLRKAFDIAGTARRAHDRMMQVLRTSYAAQP
ncbi:DUF6441 family protein [Roseococcus microcysteis]|uniref:DUF6441 family protein n=1 Tax=Roseococcus microcysteis TaxID=2771361 RepID=UPI00168A8E27|nr:DUF6441 family protein [Roseococcus microcysteis]